MRCSGLVKVKGGVTIRHTTADELLIETVCFTGVQKAVTRRKADRIIVATGGASYPQTGSTGDGYRFGQAGGTHGCARKSVARAVGRGR